MACMGKLSLFEDVPQTIVAMYYLQFLYVDDGYRCFQQFAEYPALYQMSIDPQQSIPVILLENPSIAFAVAMSMIMIVVGGIHAGFNVVQGTMKQMKSMSDDVGYQVVAVSIVVVIILLYVFSLMMPIAAVAKFGIAPHFNKEWTAALVVFIIGCISWGIMFCGCCVSLVVFS